ncbi:hypothetical protein DPMN_012186 [Dreissena polymorpha]|uniref:Uncharacterized protein n=1 Tax=Dreissena polymorpha TaxID=45954 RepID=A0A9D4N6H9_DREPO|nr:hypothetical protein DPMN_012186 [Dreissena polymorpha]
MFHTHKIVFGKFKKFIPTVRSLGCQGHTVLFSLPGTFLAQPGSVVQHVWRGPLWINELLVVHLPLWIGVASKWWIFLWWPTKSVFRPYF